MKQPVPRFQRRRKAFGQPIVKAYAILQASQQASQRGAVYVVKELSRAVGVGFDVPAVFKGAGT